MDLTNALWITLIGMGLVFVAILILWGLMALLVRLTQEPAVEEGEAEPLVETSAAAELGSNAIPEEGLNLDRKRRAAAVAVAIALAQTSGRPSQRTRELQPAGRVSPWQAVHRASQMSQRVHAMKNKVVR